jgi:transcriptional regulator of acetoin/glycerol metabolism
LDEAPEIIPYSDTGIINHTINHLPPASWKAILQEKKQSILQSKVKATSKSKHTSLLTFTPNIVKVIDKAYLQKKFHITQHVNIIDTISQQYDLNEEQDRAFKIIANHVVLPNSEPLKMYMGGMGGTGKSRVIQAISNFFERRNEAYRFIIVAPTGTAAALLSGSIYHSVFGINDMNNESQATKTLMQVRTRLLEVDYIFMDEVSMLSCIELVLNCAE